MCVTSLTGYMHIITLSVGNQSSKKFQWIKLVIWEHEVNPGTLFAQQLFELILIILMSEIIISCLERSKRWIYSLRYNFSFKDGSHFTRSQAGFNLVANKIRRWVKWAKDFFFSLFELAWHKWKALYRGRQAHLKPGCVWEGGPLHQDLPALCERLGEQRHLISQK